VFSGKVRRSGNSLAVTIPKAEAERLGLREGQRVEVEALPVESVPVLPADEQAALTAILRRPGMDGALTRALAWERARAGRAGAPVAAVGAPVRGARG
jgi:antitoxin component of MazEF toxin-antitoxin module